MAAVRYGFGGRMFTFTNGRSWLVRFLSRMAARSVGMIGVTCDITERSSYWSSETCAPAYYSLALSERACDVTEGVPTTSLFYGFQSLNVS